MGKIIMMHRTALHITDVNNALPNGNKELNTKYKGMVADYLHGNLVKVNTDPINDYSILKD